MALLATSPELGLRLRVDTALRVDESLQIVGVRQCHDDWSSVDADQPLDLRPQRLDIRLADAAKDNQTARIDQKTLRQSVNPAKTFARFASPIRIG